MPQNSFAGSFTWSPVLNLSSLQLFSAMFTIGAFRPVQSLPMLKLGRTRRSDAIRRFLIDSVISGRTDFIAEACNEFRVSRQTIHRHLAWLVESNHLVANGSTRARRYRLGALREKLGVYELAAINEHTVYQRDFGFVFDELRENVREICDYGFTEIVNNAIDHSEGAKVMILAHRDHDEILILIADDGEGIFRRIARLMQLADPREAILELSKGKLTTDPANHTGEGIFFTSRAFDFFAIKSGDLAFVHLDREDSEDWLHHERNEWSGTQVSMSIRLDSERSLTRIWDEFAGPDEYRFDKTVVPVRLALYEGERLISRSQAKRLLNRVEKFTEVILDFEGVDSVGRSFVDEVFRVFARVHPHLTLDPINMTPAVARMVHSVRGNDG